MERHFISYPKSGRTWIRYAFTLLGIANQVQFHHDGFEFNDGTKPTLKFDYEQRTKKYSAPNQVVYLSRDPMDLMVSLYYQVTGRFVDFFEYQGDLSHFIRDDYFGAHNLHQFRLMWKRLCVEGYALHISYEDCHEDFVSVLMKLTTYYGFSISENALRQAADESRFERMKDVEQSGEFPHPWLRPRNNSPKVRKGRAGSFADTLSDEDIQYLNSVFWPAPRRGTSL